MGKISLKKETKSMKLNLKSKPKAKPKAKPKSKTKVEIPKQSQAQGVIVNIGTNVSKPIRRRKSSAIEKKVVNKQQAPSTIYVPQAMPVIQSKQQPVSSAIPLIQQQPSMNEFINYLKQAEQHKEAIKEKENKVNELEKDKKEKKRSEVLTEDEVQDNFSTVFPSSNISPLLPSLSGGYTTPIFFKSKEHTDYDEVFRKLAKEADLRGENPNSGRITFAQAFGNPKPILTTSTTSVISNPTNKQSLTDLLSNVEGESVGNVTTRYQSIIPTEFKEVKPPVVKEEIKEERKQEEDEEDVFHDLPDEEEEIAQLEEIEQNPIPNEEIVVADEDPVIDEALKQMPENQIVLYEQQRVGQTASPQVNPIDGTIPAYLRPMNNPLPSVYLKDIVGPLSKAQADEARQARINKFDKKPILAIEPQTAQGEAEDTIKMLEELLNPKKKVSTPNFSKEEFEGYKTYTKQVGEAEKAAEEGGVTNFEEQQDSPELIALKNKMADSKFTRKDMVILLSNNGITEKNGLKYRIYANNVNLGSKSATKTDLYEHIMDEFKAGRITII